MTMQVEAGGRIRTVVVKSAGDKFIVTLDGRPQEISVHDVGGVLSLLVGTRSYEISMAPMPTGTAMVHVDGVPVEVTIIPQMWARGRRGAADRIHGAGPQRITAAMPGKIVKVLVQPGDHVQPRQGLIVVEAMKMENEVRAPLAGVVSEIHVREGQPVEAGAILATITPETSAT